MFVRIFKPLPHFVTNDEFYEATPAQRMEWNARMAMGEHEPDEPMPVPAPTFEPLDLLCTWSAYDAATPEQQRDYDRRLLESWQDNRRRDLEDDIEADRRRGFWGE